MIFIPSNLTLPAPVFWGCLAAWIPLPPSVMAGILCSTMIYALLVHLINIRQWMGEDATDDPLVPANYLNMNSRENGMPTEQTLL